MKAIHFFIFLLFIFNNITSIDLWYSPQDSLTEVKEKIKNIKNINAMDGLGETVLHKAAAAGEKEVVKLFIQYGADVNLPINNKTGNVALHASIEGGAKNQQDTQNYVKVAQILLDNNANPTIKNKIKGSTPIHYISYALTEKDFEKLFNMFIKSGANINTKDTRGLTILFWIIEQGKVEYLNILQKQFGSLIDFNIKDNSNRSIISFAKEQKNDIVRNINAPQLPQLSAIINVNGYNARYSLNENFTLTMAASARGTKQYLLDVLQRGGNPNLQDRLIGNTSVSWSIINNKPENALILLRKNADPTIKNNNGQTPMHFVMNIEDKSKRTKIIEALVKNGDNINTQDNNGNALLHTCILKKYDKITEHLLKDRNIYPLINFNLKNKEGRTPIDIAKNKRDKKLIMLLRPHYKPEKMNRIGSSGYTPLQLAVMRGNNKSVRKQLRNKNINVDIQGKDSNTALHLALKYNNLEAFPLLLQSKFKDKKKVKVDIQNKDGNTLVHELINIRDSKKQISFAKMLIEKGYRIIVSNKKGNTIIHLAAEKQNTDLISWLRKNWIKTIKNKEGKTPIDIAKNIGNQDLVNTLSAIE